MMAPASDSVFYRKMQLGPWPVLGLPLLLVCLPSLLRLGGPWPWLAVALIGIPAATFGALRVSVLQDSLELRFGVGWLGRRVPLTDIVAIAAVRNSLAWGFGLRRFPGGKLYNVWGPHAVELVLRTGERVRVGSKEPEALLSTLEQRLGLERGEPQALDPNEMTRWRKRTLVALGIAALVFSTLTLLLALEEREPKVLLDARALRVSSTLYSVRVPLGDIEEVRLLDRLPAIAARTNGYGGPGGTLRGHFLLKAQGAAHLFVQAQSPPFLLVRHSGAFLFVNFGDPERTRELAADLRRVDH